MDILIYTVWIKIISFDLHKEKYVKTRDDRAGTGSSRISTKWLKIRIFILYHMFANQQLPRYRFNGKLVYDCEKKLSKASSLRVTHN